MPKLLARLPQLKHFFAQHIGLVLILAYLVVVTIANWPAPGEWLMGWDNFSVTPDLWLNLKRTLFATWREYRGFGVASDSEVVDLFRQLPLFLLQAVVPTYLLEWIYYFGMYWLGTLGIYQLTIAIIRSQAPISQTKKWNLSLIGLAGAIFYATNLYTIEVFYTPIIMYVARYGFLPWLVLLSWQWLVNPEPKKLAKLSIISLLAAPAFLTATVFFIWLFIAASLLLFYGKFRSKVLLLICIFGLNAFWLLPFSWYTLTKSASIPKAGTFVTINEVLLNLPFERFDLSKLLTFTGDFGSGIHFLNLTNQPVPQHPWFAQAPLTFSAPWFYFTGLLLWTLGSGYLAWNAYKRKSNLGWWTLSLLLVAWWLLTKEYSPLGIAYNLLNNSLPILRVVLRFGGTKLNPLILLAGSILSGASIAVLQHWSSKFESKIARSLLAVAIIVLLIGGGWMGGALLTGHQLSPLLRVKLPTAYQHIAEAINQDSEYGRVLHLPVGLHSYWRSYSWGYYGSSFFTFLVDKPLLEKTFSPGNLEHDYFDQALTNLTLNNEQLTEAARQHRAELLGQLLQRAGIRYIILDSSIQPTITTKELVTWEVHPFTDTKLLIAEAQKLGLLTEERTALIDDANPSLGELTLFVVNQSSAAITSPPSAVAIDPALTNTFIEPLATSNQTIIQTNTLSFRSYPWWQSNYQFVAGQTQFTLTTTNQESTQVTIPAPSSNPDQLQAFDLFAAQNGDSLAIFARPAEPETLATPLSASTQPIYTITLPSGSTIDRWNNPATFLNNWHTLTTQPIGTFRLAIADQVIPLPESLTATPQFLSTTLFTQRDLANISISLLVPDSTGPALLDPQLLTTTDNPNCRLDAIDSYQGKLTLLQNSILATTNHGSLCFGTTINLQELKKPTATQLDTRNYFELAFEASSETNQATAAADTHFPLPRQQAFAEYTQQQLPLASTYVCLNTGENTPCLNRQPYFTSLTKSSLFIVPTDRVFSEAELGIFFHVLAGKNTHSLRLEKLKLLRFAPTQTKSINLAQLLPNSPRTFALTTNQLNWTYPQSSATLYAAANNSQQLQNPTRCITDPYQSRPTAHYAVSAVDNPINDILLYTDNCNITLNSSVPYYSNNPYFWTTTYQLITGNQPRLLVDAPQQVANQLFSQDDTQFPTIVGSKPFDETTSLADHEIIIGQLADLIRHPTYATASAIISPMGTTKQPTNINFATALVGANQTLVRLSVPTIFALPAEWAASFVESADSIHTFDQLVLGNPKKHLPSLWSVTLDTTPELQNPALLAFDQGYDPGWVLITDQFRLLPAEHIKVDGWKNGWLIQPGAKLPSRLYIFYAPELLSLGGWIITLLALGLIIYRSLQQPPYQLSRRSAHITQRILKTLAPPKK